MRGRLGLRFVMWIVGFAVSGALSAITVGCQSEPPVSGICVAKYVEHGSELEHTLVVRTGSGEDHHFEVTKDQFGKVTCKAEGGQQVNGADLDVPGGD